MTSVPSVTKAHVNRCLVGSFSGEMDYLTAPMFRTEFLRCIDSGEQWIVLDLAGVPFCDSAGLNALLVARRRALETGVTLALVSVQPQLRQLLELTGVDRILDVYDTAENAADILADTIDGSPSDKG
ncbi:STAS domain-containing protein [Streptomyces sp. NRRL B-3648]|uniref:STAS domain-containing protein n=1 Tax=Streptomyces sp. NRRL B-3648 TaxID=1519493 RepID=UPI0006B0619C|nr:STAS domain-containing protein [Streptomyces sp. NRRL B-3648]